MTEKKTRLEELSDILDWNLLDVINHFALEPSGDGEYLNQFKPLTREERKKVTAWVHELSGKSVKNGWFIPE